MYKALLGPLGPRLGSRLHAAGRRERSSTRSGARERSSSRRASRSAAASRWPTSTAAPMDVDGRVSLGLNPDGPVDRQFNLIRLESARRQSHRPDRQLRDARHRDERAEPEDQRRRAGYGRHATSRRSSAERCCTSTAPPATSRPIYSVYPNPQSGHLSQFRVLLGDRILAPFGRWALAPQTSRCAMRRRWSRLRARPS